MAMLVLGGALTITLGFLFAFVFGLDTFGVDFYVFAVRVDAEPEEKLALFLAWQLPY